MKTMSATVMVAAVMVAAYFLSAFIPPTVGAPQCHGTETLRGWHDKSMLAATRGIKDPWNYQLDHYIPLCLGGLDIPSNLRFQPWPEARVKDEDERALCESVCAGKSTQDEAIKALTDAWPPGDIR